MNVGNRKDATRAIGTVIFGRKQSSNYLLNKNLLIDDDPNKTVSDMQSIGASIK
ncbi:hypothetical protein RBU61_07630 [Tissierella sp. MB52-C2]|uniref:hypothetical protein n=1 Tax=Tissierella sp. MB52-C2 TaxID=3070999 RepID=UPI00280AA62A|nr:hypothetical protein [Tissierella sp. MB52-C2]WMM26534.1 hypothetical protein RBU61_07630 [Tissierella sp. MB52-C2]